MKKLTLPILIILLLTSALFMGCGDVTAITDLNKDGVPEDTILINEAFIDSVLNDPVSVESVMKEPIFMNSLLVEEILNGKLIIHDTILTITKDTIIDTVALDTIIIKDTILAIMTDTVIVKDIDTVLAIVTDTIIIKDTVIIPDTVIVKDTVFLNEEVTTGYDIHIVGDVPQLKYITVWEYKEGPIIGYIYMADPGTKMLHVSASYSSVYLTYGPYFLTVPLDDKSSVTPTITLRASDFGN